MGFRSGARRVLLIVVINKGSKQTAGAVGRKQVTSSGDISVWKLEVVHTGTVGVAMNQPLRVCKSPLKQNIRSERYEHKNRWPALQILVFKLSVEVSFVDVW